MSSKPIEEYTDKELENAIKLHETELRKNKNDFVNRKKDQSALEIKQLQQVIMQEEVRLRKTHHKIRIRNCYDG